MRGVMAIEETIEAIRHLETSDGWRHVKKYIDSRIADHTKQLLTCDLDQVILHRKAIDVLSLIYTHMEELKNEPTE